MNFKQVAKLPNDSTGLPIKLLLGSAFAIFLYRKAKEHGKALGHLPEGYKVSIDREKLIGSIDRLMQGYGIGERKK